jgi:hypothetical protein
VSQVVLRPKLSIPLINYFVSILATVMVRWFDGPIMADP